MREKILKSLNSSDMSDEQWENAAHVVASLGAAQIGNRGQLSIGAMLLHVRAGHIQFLPRVQALVAHQIVSRARRSAWKGVGRHNANALARIALERFLNVLCGSCNGVGRVGELGQVIVICQTCKGTGKSKEDAKGYAADLGMSGEAYRTFGIAERLKDVLALLDRMEGIAAAGTKRQARGDAED
jgi:hypothetical protein